MENTRKGTCFEMGEKFLKIVGMIITGLSTIMKAVDLVERLRHQKGNRSEQG